MTNSGDQVRAGKITLDGATAGAKMRPASDPATPPGNSPLTTLSEPFEPSCPRCGDLLIVGSTVCPSCYAIVTVIETRAPRDFREPVRTSVDTVDNGRDHA